MKIKSNDGLVFYGHGPDDLALQLWKSMFDPDKTIELWMQNMAYRAKQWNGAIIRCDNVEVHFEDLIKAKIIEVLSDDYEVTDSMQKMLLD